MNTKFKNNIHAKYHSFGVVRAVAVLLQFGVLAGSAQTNQYLFSGSETNITLNPGTYIITAYGAQGGSSSPGVGNGGLGAEMSAQFNFTVATTLTVLVGGNGGSLYGGGGGGSFVVIGSTALVIAGGGGGTGVGGGGGSGQTGPAGGAGGGGGYSGNGGNGGVGSIGHAGNSFTSGGGGGGAGGGGGGAGGGGGGGGGSYYDSSGVFLADYSGIASPNDSPNGEIIIIAVSSPLAITTDAALGFTNGVFGFNVSGPSGSNVVIQASTDLQTWIPLQINLLGTGPLYFSDSQSPANIHRFYRAQFLP